MEKELLNKKKRADRVLKHHRMDWHTTMLNDVKNIVKDVRFIKITYASRVRKISPDLKK